MPGLLKIADLHERGYLAFDIGNLLSLIPDEGSGLAWSVFPMGEGTDIVGDFTSLGINAAEFCSRVDENNGGVVLTWDGLRDFAALVHQTTWGTYVGCRDAAAFPVLAALYQDAWLDVDDATPAYYEAVDFAFQAIDSSFWLAYARNDAVLERLRSAFQRVTVLRRWE